MFDESHGNFTNYPTLRSLLTSEGYTVVRRVSGSGPLTLAELASVSVLVLPITGTTTVYSTAELAAVEQRVRSGDGPADRDGHLEPPRQADPVAARFGIGFGPDIGTSSMTITPHPITAGVTNLLRDFGAASIIVGASGISLLASPTGTFFSAHHDGGPETMLGRVVVMTDINIFADNYEGDGSPMTAVGEPQRHPGLEHVPLAEPAPVRDRSRRGGLGGSPAFTPARAR
ncbi:MAG: hypothetical protein M5U28_21555 [Sandaracinaceae bacterium]|nr:hypothetical protein [Sandaracinaceae bacterium]